MEVTANSCKRKDFTSRQKMEKRFFLDWVNMNGAGIPIYHGSQHTVNIDSDTTLTALAGLNQALFWT